MYSLTYHHRKHPTPVTTCSSLGNSLKLTQTCKPPCWQMPCIQSLRADGQHLRAESAPLGYVVDMYLGVRGIKHSLARRVRELEQQQFFLALYGAALNGQHHASYVGYDFVFCSDYPPHLPLVQALRCDTYHHGTIRNLWSVYA